MTATAPERDHLSLRQQAEAKWGKSDLTLRIEAARDEAATVTRCAFCKWSHAGSFASGREAAAAHRASKHPEAAKPRPRRKKVYVGQTEGDREILRAIERNKAKAKPRARAKPRPSGKPGPQSRLTVERIAYLTDERTRRSLRRIAADVWEPWGYKNANSAKSAFHYALQKAEA